MTSSSPQEKERAARALAEMINTSNFSDSKKVVEQNKDVLLGDVMNEVFAVALTVHRNDPNAVEDLLHHQMLLHVCRDEGIDAAYSDLVKPEKRRFWQRK